MAPRPPVALRCEYLVEPLGVDTPSPRLSWTVESPARGDRQKACQVLVSSARELLQSDIGDLWDTGMIDAEKAPVLEYAGEALRSCSRYFWKARWWDGNGAASPWSEPSFFVTGFLYEGDWKPKWISARQVREFRTKGTVLLGHPGADDTQACGIYLKGVRAQGQGRPGDDIHLRAGALRTSPEREQGRVVRTRPGLDGL